LVGIINGQNALFAQRQADPIAATLLVAFDALGV
jgi:hypothetical protein